MPSGCDSSGNTSENGKAEISTDEANKLDNIQDVPESVSETSIVSKNNRERFSESLIHFREQEALDLHIGDEPQEGMVETEQVIRVAGENARSTCNTNKLPEVTLVDDFFIVKLEQNENPFRAGRPGLDSYVGIDAWTGELIALHSMGGGVRILHVSKETGAGRAGENPTATEFRQRLFNSLEKMELDVIYGRPWNPEPVPEMIPKEEAIRIAGLQVANRGHDKSKTPLPVLVDGLYIVTFWRPNPEELPSGAPTFDTRVGIDAYTGEYIAMEIIK